MNVLTGAEPGQSGISFEPEVSPPQKMVFNVPGPLLPVRLAWRQLRAERARLLVALAGVMFASVLVLMQFGFRGALFDTASKLPQAIQGELFLIHPLTTALFRAEPVPRIRGYETLASPEVVQAVPIYLAQEPWRNPITGIHRVIQIIAFDVQADAIAIPGLAPLATALTRDDTVAFDSLGRPEFGDIERLLAERDSVTAELGNREVTVIGTVKLGASFGDDGNVIMSAANFQRLVPGSHAAAPALIALRLATGSDVGQVRSKLSALLPPDVRVVTHAELVQWEMDFWNQTTPIGVIFAVGSVMGLMVGMVIVYQILFSDVCSHMRGYATLRALGFSHCYLQCVVLGEAGILACVGFLPGLLLSALLYRYVGRAAHLSLELTCDRCLVVFGLILAMCAFAGLLALRKLREADPVSVF